jgi:DNA uptake protein ComE-like DNA-binding protein
VEQVGETFGLKDSTFQKIKPILFLNTAMVVLININEATKESLGVHPYIRWQLAKAIVDYRNQHGRFGSVNELMQLALMDSVKFLKLKPYTTIHTQVPGH